VHARDEDGKGPGGGEGDALPCRRATGAGTGQVWRWRWAQSRRQQTGHKGGYGGMPARRYPPLVGSPDGDGRCKAPAADGGQGGGGMGRSHGVWAAGADHGGFAAPEDAGAEEPQRNARAPTGGGGRRGRWDRAERDGWQRSGRRGRGGWCAAEAGCTPLEGALQAGVTGLAGADCEEPLP